MERREPFLNSKTLAANEGRLNNSAAQRLAPDHGTSPAPFPFILPLIPTRPRSAPPGSFTTHSLKKGSSFFYTSQRPANLLRFARPRSNDDSNTAYDEAANELMAKPWSCSTFSEGILEQDIPDECKSEPPVRYHQSPESRMKWPHSLDATCMSPSKFPEDKQAPASKDTPAMFVLSMFQNGPDPWSQYSRRDPGTMCALCGHRFTGSSHKVNARRHVRNSHASLQHSFFTARENPLGMSVLKDGKHCHGLGQGVGWPTPESITPSFGIGRLHSATSAKYPDLSLPGSSLQNLATYKSSHIFTVSSPIQASAAASTSNPFSVDFDHQSYVQERMAYLISQLDPRTYPNRVNDFFNGLDIVIGDLRERFPDDLLTLGMQNALVRLENQYLLNCVHNASKTSQSELSSNIDTCAPAIDGEASSSTQPSGASSSTTQKDSTTRPVNGSDAPDQETSTPNRQQDAIQARSGRRKEKKKKNRPLACPIKKHYEAHNQRPLCDFKGGYMSEVAQHLRTRVHRPFLPILTLCRACWAYAISEGEYNNVHRNGHCNQGEQPRKEKAAEIWLDLYRKIYPQSERIPSPYVDDRTWTTVQTGSQANLFTAVHISPENNSSDDFNSHRFLDFNSIAPHNHPTFNHFPGSFHQGTTEQDADAAAMEILSQVFRELIQQPTDLSEFDMNRLMNQVRQMRPEAIAEYTDRFRARANVILQWVQRHAHPTPWPVPGAPIPSTSIYPTTYGETTGPWIGHFPTPLEMPRPTHFLSPQFQMPAQEHMNDSFVHWEDQFIIPHTSSDVSLDILPQQQNPPPMPQLYGFDSLRSTIFT